MWFKWICFVLAIACIIKAFIGLLFHEKFYAWDRDQYASKRWPASFIIFLPYGILIFLVTWYATIFQYTKYGWILTLVVTISSIKLFAILFNWEKTSATFVRFIDSAGWKLWAVDIFVMVAGFAFFLMGTLVYS